MFRKNTKKISGCSQKGFTLLESLVAIAILLMSITAATTAVQTALSSSIFAKNQVISFFLAQEAVEYIKNTRDNNALQGQNWLNGYASSGSPCVFGTVCTVDATLSSGAFSSCGGAGSCPVLRQSSSAPFLYGYNSGWVPTGFRREIVLSQVNANEITATVNVTFTKGTISKTITVRESIFNWQ